MMLSDLYNWVYSRVVDGDTLIITALLLFIVAVFNLVRSYVRIQLRRAKINKYYKILKHGPLIFRFNQTEKPVPIFAIATSSDFSDALAESRYIGHERMPKPWMGHTLRPKRTFTFAPTLEDKRDAHTGIYADLRSALKVIAERGILKVSLDEFTPSELDQIFSGFFVRDKRLFVPYAMNNEEEGERQWKYYGLLTMRDLHEAATEHIKKQID